MNCKTGTTYDPKPDIPGPFDNRLTSCARLINEFLDRSSKPVDFMEFRLKFELERTVRQELKYLNPMSWDGNDLL